MTIIDSPPHANSPISTPTSVLPKLAIALVGLVLIVIVSSLFAAIFLLNNGDGTAANEVTETNEEAVPVSSRIGEQYFGEVTLAQGSSVNFAVTGQNIQSAEDITVVSTPPGDGLVVSILAGEDPRAPQLELAVPTDYPVGVHTLNFEITGEPEVVVWVFTVTPR